MKAFCVASVFALVGCGAPSEGGGDSPAPIEATGTDTDTEEVTRLQSLTVETEDDLPACEAAIERQLVYVEASEKFQTCKKGKWVNISIAGKDGEDGADGVAGADGEDGVDGEDGADGNDGTDNRITRSITCTGQVGATAIDAVYIAHEMASGDVFVSGSVRDSGIQVGTATFYSSQQVGVHTGPLIFGFDGQGTGNYGWWKLTLDRTTLVVSIEYHDSDNPSGNTLNWTWTSDKCAVVE